MYKKEGRKRQEAQTSHHSFSISLFVCLVVSPVSCVKQKTCLIKK